MASNRKRVLSVDGPERGDISGVGRSGERPAKVARKKRVTIAAADITETDKQGMESIILMSTVKNIIYDLLFVICVLFLALP